MRPEHWIYTVPLGLRTLFRRRRVDQDLDDELRYHIEQKTADNAAKGMTAQEARRAALLGMRELERAKEECRDARRVTWLQDLGQDLHFGLRMLRKFPGFTAVAVLTLALGIGANTSIFSVVNAALLNPLPFRNPSSLVIVWENELADSTLDPVSPPNFLDWQEQSHCFSGMAAFVDAPMNLTGAIQPEQVGVEKVSPNFFSVLGVAPMLGRGFSKGEDQSRKSDVAVLSYGLWKSQFGGDPNIIGKAIQLNGQSVTIIGVAGPDFDFYIREHSAYGLRPQLWAPLDMPPEWHQRSKVGSFLRIVARLNPGISLSQAQAQMNVVAANMAARFPDYDTGLGVALVSLRDQLSGTIRAPLLILLGAVGFVLLIACANLSSLLLSRVSVRRHEIAIRLAVGASPSRVARQLLTESLLLGVLGGAAGTFVTVWATKALIHAGSGLHYLSGVTVDWHVLVFAVGVTLLATLLAGSLPSFMTARVEGSSALSGGGHISASRQSLAVRNAFVVLEISLALVLLVGSGLLIESFFRLTEVNPGFQVAHLLTFQVTLTVPKYRQETTRAAFFSQLLNEIRALPGVISATADLAPPFDGLGITTLVSIVGEPPRPPGEGLGTRVRVIEPGYFRTLGIPLLHGRTFNEREFAQQSNVVIINKAFADEYFRGENPLGRKITVYMSASSVPDEIIGVVGDVHESSLAAAPDPLAYWPYPELPYKIMTVVVRTVTPPLSLVPAIGGTLHRIDKDQPMAKITTMDQLVATSLVRSRFMMLLLSVFAGLALVLACFGTYGVMAYSVAQRTREIGIRMALGAQKSGVVAMVINQGLKLALIGVGAGIAGAFVLTRLLSSFLYGIRPTDPLTFIIVSLILTGVSLLACYIPARRAMRVDPMVALRHE
jgi:putative ABC transport system permease protein